MLELKKLLRKNKKTKIETETFINDQILLPSSSLDQEKLSE